jgi:hypothetical protein
VMSVFFVWKDDVAIEVAIGLSFVICFPTRNPAFRDGMMGINKRKSGVIGLR